MHVGLEVMNMTKLCAMLPLLPSTAGDPIIRKDAAEDPFATAEAQLLFVQTGFPDDYLTRSLSTREMQILVCEIPFAGCSPRSQDWCP